jgi:hypothetical protein
VQLLRLGQVAPFRGTESGSEDSERSTGTLRAHRGYLDCNWLYAKSITLTESISFPSNSSKSVYLVRKINPEESRINVTPKVWTQIWPLLIIKVINLQNFQCRRTPIRSIFSKMTPNSSKVTIPSYSPPKPSKIPTNSPWTSKTATSRS